MLFDKDSLTIVPRCVSKGYTVDFKFYVLMEYNKVLNSIETFYFGDDYWNIEANWNGNNHCMSMKLSNLDESRGRKGTWCIMRIDVQPLVSIRMNSIAEEIIMNSITEEIIMNLKLPAIRQNPFGTFTIKIELSPETFDNQKVGGLLTDLQRNYEDLALSGDKQIITEVNEAVNVHKAILTLRSPVFKAMFDSKMTESNSNQIFDFDEITIKRMAEFLYKDTFTDIAGTSYEDLLSLLAIANKYEINSLKNVAISYLMKILNIDNVAVILNKAILYESNTLLTACRLFIKVNSNKLFNDESFLLVMMNSKM